MLSPAAQRERERDTDKEKGGQDGRRDRDKEYKGGGMMRGEREKPPSLLYKTSLDPPGPGELIWVCWYTLLST